MTDEAQGQPGQPDPGRGHDGAGQPHQRAEPGSPEQWGGSQWAGPGQPGGAPATVHTGPDRLAPPYPAPPYEGQPSPPQYPGWPYQGQPASPYPASPYQGLPASPYSGQPAPPYPPYPGAVPGAGGPARPPAAPGVWGPPGRLEAVPGTRFALGYLPVPTTTSGMAVGSLVAGIASVLVSLLVACFGLIGAEAGWGAWVAGAFAVLSALLGLGAIGLGAASYRHIQRPPTPSDRRTGRGFAIAGISCGSAGVALTGLMFAVALAIQIA